MNHIVLPMAGDMVRQKIFAKAAVGINNCDASASVEVGRGHVQEQRTFSCTGAAEERHVLAARIGRHDELGFAEKVVSVGSDRCRLEHKSGNL